MNLTSNLDTIRQDLRHAFRGVPRNWSFTLAAVFAIALGVGATTAVFSVVDRILFRGLPYAHDERLVSLGMVAASDRFTGIPVRGNLSRVATGAKGV